MITFAQGENHTHDVTGLGDVSDDLADLTGAVGILTVYLPDGTVAFTKSTEVSEEGEALTPLDTSETFRFYFVPADSAALSPGRYPFVVWATAENGNQYQAVPPDLLILTDG
jgi:hypothetical protein